MFRQLDPAVETRTRPQNKGNGNYSYLDSLQEARKVLVAEASSTLVTIAKDVKAKLAPAYRGISRS